MSASDGLSTGLRSRQNAAEVDFAQIFANAQQTLQLQYQNLPSQQNYEPQQPRRLADAHTARAVQNVQAPSTFESQQQGNALRRMSTFINDNMSTIRRLSRLPAEYDFTQLMATYGNHLQSADRGGAKTPSSNARIARTTTSPISPPLPAPLPLRLRAQTTPLDQMNHPQSTQVDQLNHRRLPSSSPNSPPNSNTPVNPGIPTQTNTAQKPISSMPQAAVAILNRRNPPRSHTPLPASPRASLALSAMGSVRSARSGSGSLRNGGIDTALPPLPPLPPINQPLPPVPAGLQSLKLAATASGDERMFQQVQAKG